MLSCIVSFILGASAGILLMCLFAVNNLNDDS